jgi:putative ATP-dependent endonuclease of the OLD family
LLDKTITVKQISGKGSTDEIVHKHKQAEEVIVELGFDGIQEAITKMSDGSNKTTLQNKIGHYEVVKIRKSSNESKRKYFDVEKNSYEDPGTGFDKALNEFLPKLEYISTSHHLKDKAKYGKTNEIGTMLSGVIDEILKSKDQKYLEFINLFNELFTSEESTVSNELNKLANEVAVNLQKQFPECERVEFVVKPPIFEDLLKNFDVNLDDGVHTKASDKGDGLQRALMLAIIQTFAQYRRKNNGIKNFIFIIDEAELHLHPLAQRKLKSTLIELADGVDQVLISAHSSVFLSGFQNDNASNFQVYKENHETSITKILESNKPYVIFDLLGGSPSDLLLPRNFLIVEGVSDKEFIDLVIKKYYSDKPSIHILFARGDGAKIQQNYDRIHQTYLPVTIYNNKNEEPIYKYKAIILCDKPNKDSISKYNELLKLHPWLEKNNLIYLLAHESLEQSYPAQWSLTKEEIEKYKNNSQELSKIKRELARKVGAEITQESFETEMSEMFNALTKCWEMAFK